MYDFTHVICKLMHHFLEIIMKVSERFDSNHDLVLATDDQIANVFHVVLLMSSHLVICRKHEWEQFPCILLLQKIGY